MQKNIRMRYWFNKHTTPSIVALTTKQYVMTALYEGMRKLPVAEFVAAEIVAGFHFGYHTFDIDAHSAVHEQFTRHMSGKIHAIAEQVLVDVAGELKWKTSRARILS